MTPTHSCNDCGAEFSDYSLASVRDCPECEGELRPIPPPDVPMEEPPITLSPAAADAVADGYFGDRLREVRV